MFFINCSIIFLNNLNNRFIPYNECIFILNSIFLNIFINDAGGAIFCNDNNKKLKIYQCLFKNIQSGNGFKGGAIYFNILLNGNFYLKCSLAENCSTFGSNTYEQGQFTFSSVSEENSYNIFEDNSINKCSLINKGYRFAPIYLTNGIINFEYNNISNIHVYYYSNLVFYKCFENFFTFNNFFNSTSTNSMAINFCQGKHWFNFSNLINLNQLTSNYGLILSGCTGGIYTETFIFNCNFINNFNFLFQKTKGLMEIKNCFIQSSFISSGASISNSLLNSLNLNISLNCFQILTKKKDFSFESYFLIFFIKLYID